MMSHCSRSFVVILTALLAASTVLAVDHRNVAVDMSPSPVVTSCDGGDGWQNVTCPTASSTCCPYHWSNNVYGCCPMPNAVCCSNTFQCCPAGTTCQDTGSGFSVHTVCVRNNETVQVGEGICKIGPQFPSSTTQPNILVMGDSVSIGWTPDVAVAMADEAFVQHTPWSGDGGSSCTQYSLRCLDRFLSSPSGQELGPVDIFYFNSGMHNLLVSGPGNPGQTGNTTVYKPELAEIASRLQAWANPRGTKLLFGLTTPFLCNKTTDDIVQQLNADAMDVMTAAGIPTLDTYTPVIKQCGEAPVQQCLNGPDCFCPHCVHCQGYPWLANTTIVPKLRAMLKQ